MTSETHRYSEEEDIAKQLYDRLQKQAFVSELGAGVTIAGEGVHWHCTIVKNEVIAEVSCFLDAYGPEYLTFFKLKLENKAALRIRSIEETISAVSTWIRHADINILYENHLAVDEEKRNLTALYQSILKLDPSLSQDTSHELTSLYGLDRFYNLNFWHENRSCVISAADHFQKHLVSFSDDEVELCNFREKSPTIISKALKAWLLESHSPIMLGKELENLLLDEVAIYYEVGRPIVGEFVQSWKTTEQIYLNMGGHRIETAQAFGLLVQMRVAGYDQILRAGQALTTLIVSRSRRHGLQSGQPCIYIDISNNEINIRCSFPDKEDREFKVPYYSSRELSPDILQVLDELASYPIS